MFPFSQSSTQALVRQNEVIEKEIARLKNILETKGDLPVPRTIYCEATKRDETVWSPDLTSGQLHEYLILLAENKMHIVFNETESELKNLNTKTKDDAHFSYTRFRETYAQARAEAGHKTRSRMFDVVKEAAN